MSKYRILLLLCLYLEGAQAQSLDSVTGKVLNFPARLLGHIQSRTASINQQLTQQTQKMLQTMGSREARMEKKLAATDSSGAKQLFGNTQQEYASLLQRLRSDSSTLKKPVSGVYQPYVDSLSGALAFLSKNQGALTTNSATLFPNVQSKLQGATGEWQSVQSKLQIANEAKAFVQQRKQQIGQYVAQHANLQGLLNKPYSAMNQQLYYFSQRVQQYRDMLGSPDKLEKAALARLSGLPAFQSFMKNNGQLSGLFRIPGSSGAGGSSAQPLPGLQTHSQIAQQVDGHLSAAGPAGMGEFQSKLQSAQQQLNSYKGKLNQLGAGTTSAADVPDFRPNDQKTKTLWHRLEYGANFQTSHTNYYYPIVTDLGLSLGYRLGHGRIIGIGASYKLGWGSGFDHIALSSQGLGLRSFIQQPLKGSFSVTGGFEYNYTTPFTSYQQLKQLQYWTKSGLIGITKTISMKSRVFKKTQLQLLWDFLSYQQVPKTQPILFRIGYTF